MCLDLWVSVPAARRQHNDLDRNSIEVVASAKLAVLETIGINKLLISKQQIDYCFCDHVSLQSNHTGE